MCKDLINNNKKKESRTFHSYFSSVFQAPATENERPTTPDLPTGLQLREITFGEEEVFNRLRNLDISESNGPDGIPARLLKECCQEIAPSLCTLFNLSLQTGRILSEWKSADVTPVNTKNSKKPAENYKPIQLLLIVSKVLERVASFHIFTTTLFGSSTQHNMISSAIVPVCLSSCQFSTPLVKTWRCEARLSSARRDSIERLANKLARLVKKMARLAKKMARLVKKWQFYQVRFGLVFL